MNTIEEIIKALDLKPHPEGGYFKETYRSKGTIKADSLDPEYQGSRNYSTSIYFLLTSDNFSAFHRIKQDEFWHFYLGSTIALHTISPEGIHQNHLIGNNFRANEVPQFVVSGGDWFAAEVLGVDSFALVGCTVSPGFNFDDFELANQENLITKYPKLESIIKKFTR